MVLLAHNRAVMTMAKYFILAVLSGLLAAGFASEKAHGAAAGFAVAAGLCILAAAVVERREPRE